MEAEKKRLKVYCETSFWSYLNGGRTPLEHVAVKQAVTLQWWEEIAPSCDIYVSQYVGDEAADGDAEFARRRIVGIQSANHLDGLMPEVKRVAGELIRDHAVPDKEMTDAMHIATASVHGMDVLLTWNCRHMANPVTLPKTAMTVGRCGHRCPAILTPAEFIERKEELCHEDD